MRAALLSLLLLLPIALSSSPLILDGISNFLELNQLMERHFVRNGTLTLAEFESRLPTAAEQEDMQKLIELLMIQKDWKRACDPSILSSFPSLKDELIVAPFLNDFCLIYEPLPSGYTPFPRAFGYVAIRKPGPDVMPLHHSAAHFESDGPVAKQAAILFQKTNSRSLAINGINRFAVKGNPKSSCQPTDTIADAAHNTDMMFHSMLLGLYASMKNNVNDHFIQWHGMASTSCPASDVFVSLGYTGKNAIYTTANIADKIMTRFNSATGGTMVANTPKTDGVCKLTAGSNVFGRFVHGVPNADVCTGIATIRNERFIHVEQKMAASEDLDTWITVLNGIL